MTPEQRMAVVQEARQWLGTPWHHMADVRGVGVDCVMLLVRVFNACGLVPAKADPRPYAQDWHLHKGEELYLSGLGQYAVPTADPQPGDIAMFQFGRCVAHGAIVVAWPLVIHAYMNQGAVVLSDVSTSQYLQSRLRGCYTIKEEV